jgi:isoleucyl-tRNA synthetase
MENRGQTRRNSVGSVEELYNEIEKSIAAALKENPFKGFEVGNMAQATMI